MSRHTLIASLDMSPVDGVAVTHRPDIPFSDPNYTVFELSYRGATQYLITSIRSLSRTWADEKVDCAHRLKQKVDSDLARLLDMPGG